MATLAGLVDRTYEILFGVAQVERPAEDTISAELSGTSITVATDSMWKRGDYAEFDDGELVIFVADASGATTVRRAQRGTSSSTQASGNVIRKNPWPLRITVERMVNEVVLNELWPTVWTWHQGTISYTLEDHLYDLPEYIEDVVTLEQANVDGDGKFRPLSTNLWDVERQLSASIATNKTLLRLDRPYDVDSDIYYRGKRRPHPDDLGNLDEILETVVAWGAAAKCFVTSAGGASSDRARNQRRDAEVNRAMYQMLMGEFLRMKDERNRQLMKDVRPDMRWRPRMRKAW